MHAKLGNVYSLRANNTSYHTHKAVTGRVEAKMVLSRRKQLDNTHPVASQPFVTVVSGYPCSTLNGTVTCSSYSSIEKYETYAASWRNMDVLLWIG